MAWSYPPEWRVLFVGMTRSGKTEALVAFTSLHLGRVPLGFLDTKGTRRLAGLDAFHIFRLEDVPRLMTKEVWVYHPQGQDLSPQRLDAFCELCYQRLRPGIIAIDEVGQLNNMGTTPLPGFVNLITRGEEKGVGVPMGTQRPRRIPVIVRSESSLVVKFRLKTGADRAIVADDSHPLMNAQPRHRHGAHVWDLREPETVRYFPEVVHLGDGGYGSGSGL